MRDHNLLDHAAELKALVNGMEIDMHNAEKLKTTASLFKRIMILAQTCADEADQQAMSIIFPPEAEE